MTPCPEVDRLIRQALIDTSRSHGPARLFHSKGGTERGLFEPRSGATRQALAFVLGSDLEELKRARNQPRQVMLTERGIRSLIERCPSSQRAEVVSASSPLYRERLVRAWRKMAAPEEQTIVDQALRQWLGDLIPAAKAEGDTDALKRAIAKELVLSWDQATNPQARDGVARAMIAIGLKAIGKPGERTPFSGLRHLSDTAVFKGVPVEIIEPGWLAADQHGEFVLQKAKVKPV